MVEALFETLFNFILIFPGGFVLWAIKGCKGRFLEVALENDGLSLLISIILMIAVFLAVTM